MRVAFTLIDARLWTGGYHYLLNLFRVLAQHEPGRITPILFYGPELPSADVAPFIGMAGVEAVCSPAFARSRVSRMALSSLLLGSDAATRRAFHERDVDAVFEVTQFYGVRLGIPVIAWMADFQHRALPEAFSWAGYWKREMGFRAQVAAGREIVLSSMDAQQACERYYPASVGRTHVIRFAVPAAAHMSYEDARREADGYGLPQEFFFMPNQFWRHKNHLLVAQALAILRERGQNTVIAASGKPLDPWNKDHFAKVCAAIESLGVGEQFRILGMIPYVHLAALMQACTALMNPSRYEGWSTTVEEARSAGVPMILSDLAVHREQAANHASYFNCDDPRALADALQSFEPLDRQTRERLAAAARIDAEQRVARFAREFAEVVERCAAPSRT
jgi:glycosyltransferase involved in cell wall biosynthesis